MIASMSERPAFVLDASVASKWQLRDEQDVAAADLVLDDFREGEIELLAPVQIRYEVVSAIRSAARRGRLTDQQGRTSSEQFLSFGIPTVDDDALIVAGYEQALRFGCSLYDGVYLALAESVGRPLLYADLRLRHALGTRFPLGLWIADYAARR